jgi:hypothetical protein
MPKAGYRRTLRRLGYSERDLSGRGSDRLVDALVPHGGPDYVIARLAEHLRAGASQVAVQPLTTDTHTGSGNRRLPMAEFRALAGAFLDAVVEVQQPVAGQDDGRRANSTDAPMAGRYPTVLGAHEVAAEGVAPL